MKCEIIIPVGPGHQDLHVEAINSVQMAAQYSPGPFETIRCRVVDDTKGEVGRSAARNQGVRNAEAEWLFFLDADDLMHPSAFANMQPHVDSLDAVWGSIVEMRDECLLERYQVPEIRNYDELLRAEPYRAIQIGHFVRRDVAAKYPFEESMNMGEDWHYYLRVWRDQRCRKMRVPFMINRRGAHSTGPREATGREWTASVHAQIGTARRARGLGP